MAVAASAFALAPGRAAGARFSTFLWPANFSKTFARSSASTLNSPSPSAATHINEDPAPTLGSYSDTAVDLSGNTTAVPSATPSNVTRISVSTSNDFKGKLEGDPSTGEIRVTNAHPAGTAPYTITVTAFNSSGASTTATFTVTVNTPTTCNPAGFASGTNISTGADSHPVSVAIGDFNGDGKQDLVAANKDTNNVSVSLGDASGIFSGVTNFGAGTSPRSVAVGDFNGDGVQDLAVANAGSDNVSILLGVVGGSFNPLTNFGAGASPRSLAVGDFNGDGKQDLAVANFGADADNLVVPDTVSILLGNGAGGFGTATNFAAGSNPISIAVGDFNGPTGAGDGKQDLVVANSNEDTVKVLLGDGAGGFGAPIVFGAGSQPLSVAVGDFNGDGKQDLVVANNVANSGAEVSVLLNGGAGGFLTATNFAAGNNPQSVGVGDFNGDGLQDIVTANFNSNDVSVLLNDGAGGFTHTNFGAGTSNPVSVAVGDFTLDGMQDIATASVTSSDISVLLRQCCPAIDVTPASLPEGTAGASYTTNLNASGGVGPYTFAAGPGTPTGLILNPNGTWSGAPSASGDFTFTVTATDSRTGCKGTRDYAITINCPILTLDPTTLPDGTVGQAYPANSIVVNGSSSCSALYNFTLSAGSLPPGLQLDSNSASASISGMPTVAGQYTFTIKAADQQSDCFAAQQYTVNVSPNCPGTLEVNSIGDDHDFAANDGICETQPDTRVCTLRAAIEEANSEIACGTITIDATSVSGTICLTSALPTIVHNVDINGPGANVLTIKRDSGGDYSIFAIGSGRTVGIDGLTIRNGKASDTSGGGIFNNGTLTVTNSSIEFNRATFGGGGIYNNGGTLTILNSTFCGNQAADGGALFNNGTSGGAILKVTNSTFSGNSVDVSGGGLRNDGSGGVATITNSTFSGNITGSEAGGVCNVNGTVNVRNTIIAGNRISNSLNYPDVFGTFNSLGHNLIGATNGSNGFGAPGDQVGTVGAKLDPKLGFPAYNGGPTKTLALLPGSPAIDKGDNCVLTGCNNNCPVVDADQRGVPRPQAAKVDIGAFELRTFVVNTADDHDDDECEAGDCSLREAINAANETNEDGFGPVRITFNIPAGATHYYYADDHCVGTVKRNKVTATTEADDANLISQNLIDPDWQHSWWSIRVNEDDEEGPLPELDGNVFLDGYSQSGACPNTNAIGAEDNAVLRIEIDGSNEWDGIGVEVCGNGGSTVQGLVINRFSAQQVLITSDHNTIQGNFIGTDVSGTLAFKNCADGILVDHASCNDIGGGARAQRNLISGNGANGVYLQASIEEETGRVQSDAKTNSIQTSEFSFPLASYNNIEGNYIGTDRLGTHALGNDVGIRDEGSKNMIGCTEPEEANVISGNYDDGVLIDGTSACENLVQGNFIGTTANGQAPLGNDGAGVAIYSGLNNVIGWDRYDNGRANTIANNTGAGVEVETGNSSGGTGNIIRANSIYSNGGLGIDLVPEVLNLGSQAADGVTPNDDKDPDTGANNLQNFPVITSATVESSEQFEGNRRTSSSKSDSINSQSSGNKIFGTLNSRPYRRFRIDFYSNAECNSSPADTPYGEGQNWIGSILTDETDHDGNVSFEFCPESLNYGDIITATATDRSGNTSEFSHCFLVQPSPNVTVAVVNDPATVAEDNGVPLVFRFTRSNTSNSPVVSFTKGGTAASSDFTVVSDANVTFNGSTGTVTFSPGSTTQDVAFMPTSDTTPEDEETITLLINSGSGYNVSNPDVASGSIVDNDCPGELIVNNTGDDHDFSPGNGVCETATGNGVCTLRAAIEEANQLNVCSGIIAINFEILPAGPVYTITPASPLPAITHAVTIDGYSQPQSLPNTSPTADNAVLKIVLTGIGAGAGADGLVANSGNVAIKGLVINRFGGNAIKLQSFGNEISGNFIGTDVSGMLATDGNATYGNDVGLLVFDGGLNTIGCGTGAFNGECVAEARNIISGNADDGVQITIDGSLENFVQGNFIGVKSDGVGALGNGGAGIEIYEGGLSNMIGGAPPVVNEQVAGNRKLTNASRPGYSQTPSLPGNIIAFNGEDGVLVTSSPDINNRITRNSIYSNKGLGINLVAPNDPTSGPAKGVTPNDGDDPSTGAIDPDHDNGPNHLQNFPLITAVDVVNQTITGTLNSTPQTSDFTIEFFASPSCDPSGHGEGKTFIGSILTTATDPNGNVGPFTLSNPIVPFSAGDVITATATDPAGNTSEFSPCSVILSVNKTGPSPALVVGQPSTYTIAVTNSGTAAATSATVKEAVTGDLDLVSATGTNWGCTPSSGSGPLVTACTFSGSIAAASASTISVVVQPKAGTGGHYVTNRYSVDPTGGTNPPDPTTCTAADTPAVGCGVPVGPSPIGTPPPPPATADLSITKTDSPDPAIVGNNLTYAIAVHNYGPDTATNVVVTDTLPPNVTFGTATPSQGSCSGTSTITCNLGTLSNGADATVQIVVTPLVAALGTDLSNTATVSSSVNEPVSDPHSNSATATTHINGCPTTFVVNDTDDAGDNLNGDGVCATGGGVCTLRAAIQEANALAACGTIDINFSITTPNTISLGTALPAVAHNVNINGPGANLLTVQRSSGSNFRIFAITSSKTVSVSGLTLSQGADNGGGGIYNQGTLTVTNLTVSDNVSTGRGGGIYNDNGTVTATNSTLSGNTAGNSGGGGGVYNQGQFTLINSTLSGNNSLGSGGGIRNFGTITVTNCTLSNNTASNLGGGFDNGSGTSNVRNTIIAGNSATTGPDISGAFTTNGHNLIGKSDGGTGFNGVGDQVGTIATPLEPWLDSLKNNKGTTKTHALLYNSPAVDTGDGCVLLPSGSGGCLATPLTTDQRGLLRPDDGDNNGTSLVDIGAYERQKPEIRSVPNGALSFVDINDARLTFPCVPSGGCAGANIKDSGAVTPEFQVPGNTVDLTLIATPNDAPAGSGPAFEVHPSSSFFTPPATVCFYLPSITNASIFATLKIYHRENTALVDRTTTRTFADKTVCAQVDSFSQFVVNQAVTPTAANGDVSGQIVDSNGNPVEGAAVHMIGTQDRLTVTDARGNYRFDNVETNGFYTVVPSRANFGFSPSQRSFSALGQHTDAVFSATPTGTAANPLDTTEYFVRQQYLDFLGREPDEAGFNFWVNNVESCGANANCRTAKRTDTSAAFFLSTEFQQTGYLVYRTYQTAFGEIAGTPVPIKLDEFKPDTSAVGNGVVVNQNGWEQKLDNNKRAYMAEFVQRPRFTAAYPGTLTPDQFVDTLFANAGVMPSASDRAAAVNEFGSATTSMDAAARGRVVRRIAENSILARKDFNQAFVLMQYFGYLRRDANAGRDIDFSGYTFWLDKLNSFDGNFENAEMVKAFLLSGEYRGRFPR